MKDEPRYSFRNKRADAQPLTPLADTSERAARENAEQGSAALARAIRRYVEKYHSGGCR